MPKVGDILTVFEDGVNRNNWKMAVLESLITRASVYGKLESEYATNFLAKRGVMVPGIPCVDRRNWGGELARDRIRCFGKKSFGKYLTLYIHLA